jgi:hypothetical protein
MTVPDIDAFLPRHPALPIVHQSLGPERRTSLGDKDQDPANPQQAAA